MFIFDSHLMITSNMIQFNLVYNILLNRQSITILHAILWLKNLKHEP